MTEPQQMRFSYLRKSAFICGCLLFLAFSAAPTFAQHGGKAEPLRIEFVTGTGTATERGTVRNSEQYEYSVTAKKGVIDMVDELVLKSGDATITLKKNGDISIKGKKITITADSDLVLKGSKIAEN